MPEAGRMKKHIFFFQTFMFLITIGFSVSCSREKSEARTDAIRRIFIHGDPEQLISGTKRDTESFISKENIGDFRNFTISTGAIFSERSSFSERRKKIFGPGKLSLLDPNQDAQFLRKSYRFVDGNVPGQLQYRSEDGTIVALQGTFDEKNLLRITHILETPIEILHYSLSKDRNTMSFLGKTESESTGKAILSVVFTRIDTAGLGPRLTDAPFNFLAGKGQLYAWNDKTITLTICLPEGTSDRLIPFDRTTKSSALSLIERAWSSWVVGGKVGNRPVKLVKSESSPPPFSDVNTNCIVSVPTYARESSLAYLTTGLTLPTTNMSQGSITSAAVLIFEQAAISAPEERGYLSTVIHELGHFFGLGHEFDQNIEGQFLRKSAMAYLENRTFFPSETDLDALEELYGKNSLRHREDTIETSPPEFNSGDCSEDSEILQETRSNQAKSSQILNPPPCQGH